MRVQRSLAASLQLSALLLSFALAVPVYGETVPSGRKSVALRSTRQPVRALGLAPPDLPASVTINASDLQPGDAARSGMSRIVADPGRILQAYAPVGGSAGTAVFHARAGTVAVRPAVLLPTEPQEPSGPPGPVPTSPAVSVASIPAVTPAVTGPPPKPAPAADSGSAPSPAAPAPSSSSQSFPQAPVSTAALPVGAPLPSVQRTPDAAAIVPPPVVQPPVGVSTLPVIPADATNFDTAALQKAIDAYVGPAPVPVGGRLQPQEQARYKDRQAIRTIYAARNFAPFWVEDGTFNAKGRSILARVDHAVEDGLDLHAIIVAVPKDGDPASQASAELALTEAAVAYGNQATGGRVDPSRIGPLVAMKPDVADPARVLGALVEASDAGEALRDFNPPQKGYALLRDKLAELRRSSDVVARGTIPYGPTLKPGMRDARVPLIRARFGLDLAPADAAETGLVYDTEVAAAVAGFQKAHHLPASGVLTIRTVAALSGGDPKRLEDEIVANMERWRWLPRGMGENRIEVNIPDFTLNVMHGDTIFHHARVVVGQPDKPTPVFSETMQFIIVNPYWNVPLSIVKKEMMPKLAADPDYFANHGYETVERDGQIYVRQPPGDSNALGRIKFMFPNQYSVYLHDTNSRSLFGNDRRALSHGCVRVDAPFKLAEAVLGKDNGWPEARVKRLVGGNERTISLPQPMPIHIVYFTAFIDDAGTLQVRDDVYGYSAKLRSALGLTGSSRPGQVATN